MSHTTTAVASFAKRLRAVAMIASALALLAPGLAQADTFDNDLAQLRDVAAQWWAGYGQTSTSCYTVVFQRVSLPIDDGRDGWLVEGQSAGTPGIWLPVCHVVFNDTRLSDRARLCTVFLHEWGHVLGLQHSTDPTNIMYPTAPGPPTVCTQWAGPHSTSAAKGQNGRRALLRGRMPSLRHVRHVMAVCKLRAT